MTYDDIWSSVLDEMRSEFTEIKIEFWYKGVELVAIDPEYIILTTEAENVCQYIRKESEKVCEFISRVIGEKKPLFIYSAEQIDDIKNIDYLKSITEAKIAEEKNTTYNEDELNFVEIDKTMDMPAKISDRSGHINYNGDYTFDNYITGKTNTFAYNACYAVATNLNEAFNPLFIYGRSGLGKTHLLYAITNEILTRNPSAKIIYIKGEEFTNQLVESIKMKNPINFRNKFRTVDVLLIDDIQFIANKVGVQEEFFHTFNALFEDHKQIILASDRPARDIKTLEDRLKSRFEWGLTADIQPPDYELRAAILKSKAEAHHIEIPNDVVIYLAENLTENIRQLEGAIKKISAYSTLYNIPITVELAKKAIADIVKIESSPEVVVARILEAVCAKYNVTKDDLKSANRLASIVNARHIATYLISKHTSYSVKQIAAVFERDRTTAINSIKVISERILEEPLFEKELNELDDSIK